MGFSCGMIRTFHINVILSPTFDGCLDPWTLITWLSKMIQFFDQVDLSYIKKARFARMKLIGELGTIGRILKTLGLRRTSLP